MDDIGNINKSFQDFVLTKFKSINQFANAVEIPYTTIKGGLERGVLGMSAQYVIKMCQILSINLESLASGKIEEIKHNTALDVNEFNLINQYRTVDKYGKKLIAGVAQHEYTRCVETVEVYKAARSVDDEKDGVVKMSKETLNKLQSTPMTDEDL